MGVWRIQKHLENAKRRKNEQSLEQIITDQYQQKILEAHPFLGRQILKKNLLSGNKSNKAKSNDERKNDSI